MAEGAYARRLRARVGASRRFYQDRVGPPVLDAFTADEAYHVVEALAAAEALCAAIPVSSWEHPCPACHAIKGHMGDCLLAAVRVRLAALDARPPGV